MYNIIKKIAPCLFASLILSGCNSSSLDVKYEDRYYEFSNSTAKISAPEFKYTKNPQFAEEVNSVIDSLLMSYLDDFQNKTKDISSPCKMDVKTQVFNDDSNLASVMVSVTTETGNAHPEIYRACKTFDFNNSKALTLSDIFLDKEWKKAVDVIMKTEVETSDDYKELWEMPSTEILNPENFYLKDKNIVFYFPPYDLSYYRRGFVEFYIPLKNLNSFINQKIVSIS